MNQDLLHMKTIKKHLAELAKLKTDTYGRDFLLTWEKSDADLRTLTLVADYYQRQHALWTRLKGLMVYPVLLLVASFLLSVLLWQLTSRVVFPAWWESIMGLGEGRPLPAATRMALPLLQNSWVFPLLFVIPLALVLVLWLRPKFRQRVFDLGGERGVGSQAVIDGQERQAGRGGDALAHALVGIEVAQHEAAAVEVDDEGRARRRSRRPVQASGQGARAPVNIEFKEFGHGRGGLVSAREAGAQRCPGLFQADAMRIFVGVD